jgi:hypothetical protein
LDRSDCPQSGARWEPDSASSGAPSPASKRRAAPSARPGRQAPDLILIANPEHLGYLALAALIGAESAGLPLPGETALIAAAVLAHSGELRIER